MFPTLVSAQAKFTISPISNHHLIFVTFKLVRKAVLVLTSYEIALFYIRLLITILENYVQSEMVQVFSNGVGIL